MPLYRNLESNYEFFPKSQEIPEAEIKLFGYRESSIRRTFYYLFCLLTGGITFFIARWIPDYKVYFKCIPCSLRYATRVLVKDDDGTSTICYIEEVKEALLSASFNQEEQVVSACGNNNGVKTQSYLSKFLYRYEMFIWDEKIEGFRKLQGLEDFNCSDLNNYHGLSHSKRYQMRGLYGNNFIDIKVKNYWKLFVEEVLNPFYIFQICSIILWSFDSYYYYAACVVFISAISIGISLHETRKQSLMLKDMASGESLVTVRNSDGEENEINSRDVVPGDVVLIPPEGCTMICDAVLLVGTCIVNESMLTGESIPVTKSAIIGNNNEKYDSEVHRRNTLFSGTQIIQTRYYSGSKVACIVVRTGCATQKGQLIRSILFPKEISFKFYSDAMKFIFILFGLATIGMFYCIYIYTSRGASTFVTLLRVLDIITIIVPPALPAALTVGTVYAQSRLKQKKIYCISPPRINFCGKLKLVCFDKTGTLTEDGLEFWCVVPFENGKDDFEESEFDPTSLSTSSHLLRAMASCHSLTYIENKIIGDPLDFKMFASTKWELEEPLIHKDTHRFDLLTPTVVKKDNIELGIIREFEFTSQLQRMSVVVNSLDGTGMVLYCKGAPEKIRLFCENLPENYDRVLDSFAVKGFRVLALAWRPVEESWHQLQRVSREIIEKDLIFVGFLVMQNSLKPATVQVIKELQSANVRSVMVTGDNLNTALSVARECGIIQNNSKVVIINSDDFGNLEYTLTSYHHHPTTTNNEKENESIISCFSYNDHQMKGDEFMNNRKVSASSETVLINLNNDSNSEMSASYHLENDNQEEGEIELSHISYCSSDTFLNMDIVEQIGTRLIQLQDSNYHFVLNGKTWSKLLEKENSDDLINKIVAKGTVYARMSPENKKQLIESLQRIGYIVAMCGDALKMAHVGISLSDAEASVAAPFTSKIPDISCVPHLIREGRCALVTSFGMFKYMALYSLVQFISVLILYTYLTNLADTQFLYIDLGITTILAVVMGRTRPQKKLISKNPVSTLVSFVNVFSILVQILVTASIQLIAIHFLISQSWYHPIVQHSGDELKYVCWETTTIFSISTFQYLTLAFIYSKGAPYRKPFYKNGLFLICYAILMVFTIILAIHPIPFLSSFFYLEPMQNMSDSTELSNKKQSYRLLLLIFPLANFLVSWLLENGLADSKYIKNLGRSFGFKKKRSVYKEILHNLNNDHYWPPIKSS